MKVELICENREKFMDLLLLADEQEDMVRKYINKGEMFALFDENLVSVCIVIEETKGNFEIKNIATQCNIDFDLLLQLISENDFSRLTTTTTNNSENILEAFNWIDDTLLALGSLARFYLDKFNILYC